MALVQLDSQSRNQGGDGELDDGLFCGSFDISLTVSRSSL